MPPPVSPPAVAKVFLSATVRDCWLYRQDLKAAIDNHVKEAKVHLQEHWNLPAITVVDACRDVLASHDIYVGLFGFRYGWIPPGHSDSITQLEFRWAVEQWKDEHAPPIIILLPTKGSEAELALKDSASDVLKQDFPDDGTKRDGSMARQSSFVAAVRQWATGRIVAEFKDLQDLVVSGSHAVRNLTGALVRNAREDRHRNAAPIPNEELGRIGREPHLKVLKQFVKSARLRGIAPALAFAVHGQESHGQLEFAQCVGSREVWKDWSPIERRSISRPAEPLDATAFACWLGREIREPVKASADAVATVATHLARKLEDTNVLLVSQTLGDAPMRWNSFVEKFWRPLNTALAAARGAAPVQHRLFLFVVDHAPAPTTDSTLFCTAAPAVAADYATLVLPLPALGPLEACELDEWLEDRANVPIDRHPGIVTEALKGSVPPRVVFERLQRADFWN